MNKIAPTILQGTRDFLPIDMAKRNLVMNKIKKVFEKFGYDPIETPVICPAETILGKYGDEGERLTYNFETSGGRKIALPFDLTVPFARYVAANYRDLPIPFKRYQIQRVWRAERPQKGRLREFYQCDIDIIGTKNLVSESEIARIIVKVFKELGFKDFVIKFNSRRLINEILRSLGIAEEKFIDVIRVVDKLDKIDKENVIEEIKKLGFDNAEDIFDAVLPAESIEKTLEKFSKYDLKEIKEFIKNCEDLGVPKKYLEFDTSLARGLDYYTGLIFEVIGKGTSLGTLCAGGRYDNLCSLFCNEDFSGVGVSFGFERIMLVLEQMGSFENVKLNSKVLITIFDENSVASSLKTYSELIDAGINCEIYFQPDKLKKQFQFADKKRIPFVIIRGPDEMKDETVTIKLMESGKQKTIPSKQLTSYLTEYYETEK